MKKGVLGTHTCARIGVLVHDIESTAKAYGELLGLPYTMSEPGQEEAPAEFMGMQTPARAKRVLFQLGDALELELIEPDHNPSVWRDGLEKEGEGLSYLSFWVKDGESIAKTLAEKGMPLTQRSQGEDGTSLYVDSRPQLKTMLQLLERKDK